jgi:hypothetical protein
LEESPSVHGLWNDKTLEEWIKDPQHFIPGNEMIFAGVGDEQQRSAATWLTADRSRTDHARARGNRQQVDEALIAQSSRKSAATKICRCAVLCNG